MIPRNWLVPGICAALFTTLLVLTYYSSDYKVVLQRPGDLAHSQICVPPTQPFADGILPEEKEPLQAPEAPAPPVEPNSPVEPDEPGSPVKSIPPVEPSPPVPFTPIFESEPESEAELEYNGITSFKPGTILDADNRDIYTIDGSHKLRLELDGNLVLYRILRSSKWQNETQILWSTGTGSVEREYTHFVRFLDIGVLEVLALYGHNEQLLWHSKMLPGCDLPQNKERSTEPSQLSISSGGEISIDNRCNIFTPMPETTGRMAVLVSGLYRSNAKVCASQVKWLTETPGIGSVEFFVYALYEKADFMKGQNGEETTVETLEQGIRQCYGEHLRTLTLKAVEDVEETWAGEAPPRCGRINRLLSQLKTLYNGAQDWLDWSTANGVKHQTVLRIRTDHEFYGDAPLLKPVSQLKGNELVVQPISGGAPNPWISHWFCSNPYGSMDVAISDQLAYGRPTAMHFYLDMYKDFTKIINMSVKKDNHALRESFLCLSMPQGTDQKNCDRVEYCTIECTLSWYLQMWDIEILVNWNWPIRIIRP